MKKLTIALMLVTVMATLAAARIETGNELHGVKLLDGSIGSTVIEYNCREFEMGAVMIEGEEWQQLILRGEGIWREAGKPALPRISRAVIIPGESGMQVEVIESEYLEYDIQAAPSKGILSRETDPALVPWSFDEVYEADVWFPSETVSLGEPYIFRDYRGLNIQINPFSYNGTRGKLRVYTRLVFEVRAGGLSTYNTKRAEAEDISYEFAELYRKHFLNFLPERYETIAEEAGRMLIISYGEFIDEMQPFMEWKNQKGIATSIVDVSVIGNNSTSIQNYISSEYEQDDGLVWVLLVGDGVEVATKTYSGAGGDPQYSYLEGNDSYSEIFIGRFSAETAGEVATQVERSIYYERDIDETSGDWLQKGVGIASSQGAGQGHYGEADYVHMGYIRDDLLAYGYTEVDEIYDTVGANASMVTNALNEGRGIINYCGHGSNYSWSTTGYNVSHVNALTNDHKLPFIQSIACVNGNFTGRTCFAEAWLRATNGDAPTGAIAMFASSINQSWAPPMYAQDESVDLMCAEELTTIGGLWFNGVSYMLDESGAASMANTWHIFGDPSLQVRSRVAEAINAQVTPTILFEQETYTVPVGFSGALASLSYEGELLSQAYSGADGNAYIFLTNLPEEPVTMTLTITAYNKVTQIEEVQLVIGTGAYLQMLSYDLQSGDDSEMNAGEFASLGITMMNTGNEDAEDVELILTTESESITISDGTENISLVNVEQMLTLEECFSFTVSEAALNGEPVSLHIAAVTEDAVWNYTIGEIIYAEPGIISNEEAIEMIMEIDETASSELTIKNNNYSGEIYYTILIDETTGDRSIAGSTLTCSASSFMSGETVDWTFSCTNNSVDWEWIKDILIDFPAGVIVNSTSDFTGGTDDLEFQGELGDGATCTWHGESVSGWGYLHNGETATATVNVTIQPGFMGDIELNWQLTGDDYGSAPHQIAGSIELTASALPISWLSVDILSGSLLPGAEAEHMLNFDTAGLASGIYTADIMISNNINELIIPVTLYVDTGMTIYGDIDDNGLVEAFDSSLLLQYTVGLDPGAAPLPWEDWRIARADVDGNGTVEAYDSALILQYVVGLIAEFPAETGRDHIPPEGEADIRVIEKETTWLEFYVRGEVYSLEIMSRTHDFILGAPESDLEILLAYNPANDIYRYAAAGFEPMNRAVQCLRIPVRGKIPQGELNLRLLVNGYEYEESLYLGENGGVTPAVSGLAGIYPNPFNPSTTIDYTLSSEEQVVLGIYNIRGQLVNELVNERQGAGYYQVMWRGGNAAGERSASGTYICLLRAGGKAHTQKIVLLK